MGLSLFPRSSPFLFVIALSLLVPVALAQPAPQASLAIDGLPSGSTMTQRTTHLLALNVTFSLSNVVCSGAVAFPVTIIGNGMLEGNGSGNSTSNATVPVVVTPAQLTFSVPTGAYGNNAGLPAGQPYSGTQSAAVAIESPGLPNVTTVKVSLTATLTPPSGSNCRGASNLPASVTLERDVNIQFNNTAPAVIQSPELPIPWGVAPLAVLVAVAFMRRRAA